MPAFRPSHRSQSLRDTRYNTALPRPIALFAVAALSVLVAVIGFTGVGLVPQVARANPAVRLDSSPSSSPSSGTPTSSPTATATPAVPPSLQLVSPTSGQGPVGAHLTISGTNFTASGNVAVYASAATDCSQQTAGLAAPNASGSGTFTTTFVWPISLNGGAFSICAAGITSGAPTYQVTSATPPTLALSAPSIAVDQSLTINGSGFVGLADNSQIVLSVKDSSGHVTTLSPAVVGSDGTFSATWTVSASTGTITIQAASRPEGNAPPVLQATAQVTVTAAGSPTASPSVSPTANAGGGSTSNHQQGGSGFILVLGLLIVLLLLVGLGIAAFLLLRGRNGPPPDALYGNGGYGPGEYPGFAARNRETQKVPQLGQTGRQPTMGQYGASGVTAPRVGGVAQWDEPDPAPGPDWQPRPMSGRSRDYEAQDSGGAISSPDGGATRDMSYPSLPYPPLDPWASQGGAPLTRQPPSQRPPRGSGSGAPQDAWSQQGSERDWWGGTTNPANDD